MLMELPLKERYLDSIVTIGFLIDNYAVDLKEKPPWAHAVPRGAVARL
jgi:hypothetical protein